MSDSEYSFLDRLLHRLALQYGAIAEMSFDLDQRMVKTDPAEIRLQRNVFVSGLARAGTTVLMRRFHETGFYCSLTYRDMPFVLAPNLWQRLTSISKRESKNIERAHGDNVLINADSPESLDEVFWRIFAGSEYIQNGHLKPHEPSEELIHQYVSYVNAILSAHSPRRRRYLSKNNNNLLRLSAIHQAFPNALILIPFREPLQHAYSLLRQHRRFIKLQAEDEFMLSYMGWLGHHEFGLDHRPFLFGSVAPSQLPRDTLNYWLQLWCETYAWLEKSNPKSALFICYEDLCAKEENWSRLAALADISIDHGTGESFKLSERTVDAPIDKGLADLSAVIYTRLVTKAREQLS